MSAFGDEALKVLPITGRQRRLRPDNQRWTLCISRHVHPLKRQAGPLDQRLDAPARIVQVEQAWGGAGGQPPGLGGGVLVEVDPHDVEAQVATPVGQLLTAFQPMNALGAVGGPEGEQSDPPGLEQGVGLDLTRVTQCG